MNLQVGVRYTVVADDGVTELEFEPVSIEPEQNRVDVNILSPFTETSTFDLDSLLQNKTLRELVEIYN